MKITMYELLGMIKTGTQPYTIRFHNFNWKWDNMCKDYYNKHYIKLFDGALSGNLTSSLNDTIEILEEPKGIPEKLPNNLHYTGEEENIANKINEIIDYLKSKGDE